MKSDHRHELKTNELAEWLTNLPEWTKENLRTIIIIAALIVVIIAFYGWRTYNKDVLQVREQIEFTNLLNQLPNSKTQIMQFQGQGAYRSSILLQPASGLEIFARGTSKKQLKALALIKQAEALRAELHYGSVDNQYLTEQINKAKTSYTEALEISRSLMNPTLESTAKFGLGLCEEELGNFEKAKEIYTEIIGTPEFEGTIAVAQAGIRFDTMDDYRQELTFKPAPETAEQKLPFEITQGPVQILDMNDANLPIGINIIEQEPNGTSETTTPAPTMTTEIPIVNPENNTPNNTTTEPTSQ